MVRDNPNFPPPPYRPGIDGPGCITSTSPPPCRHDNGWWDTVRFSIAKKQVFVCTDCERILNAWDVQPRINEVR
jgi:hypothetical protein